MTHNLTRPIPGLDPAKVVQTAANLMDPDDFAAVEWLVADETLIVYGHPDRLTAVAATLDEVLGKDGTR